MVGQECPARHPPPTPLVLVATLPWGQGHEILGKYNQGEISILAGCAGSPELCPSPAQSLSGGLRLEALKFPPAV